MPSHFDPSWGVPVVGLSIAIAAGVWAILARRSLDRHIAREKRRQA